MEQRKAVVMLRPQEGMSIDPACLALLREAGSPGQVDRMIGEALEDLALGLSRLAGTYQSNQFDDMCDESVALGKIAAQVGLDRISRVAFTVAALTKGGDAVALAANLARLMRLGNDALSEIWELQDQIM